jgi:hypothetical protein
VAWDRSQFPSDSATLTALEHEKGWGTTIRTLIVGRAGIW